MVAFSAYQISPHDGSSAPLLSLPLWCVVIRLQSLLVIIDSAVCVLFFLEQAATVEHVSDTEMLFEVNVVIRCCFRAWFALEIAEAIGDEGDNVFDVCRVIMLMM